MVPVYLNEFHKRNSMACREDLLSSAKSPLSVEDVLKQSRRFGRTEIRVISSGKVMCGDDMIVSDNEFDVYEYG